MKLDRKYVMLWIVWLLMFGCIEFAALKNKKEGDTFTALIRKLMGTGTPGRNWENWAFRIGGAAFFIWIIPHFYTAIW